MPKNNLPTEEDWAQVDRVLEEAGLLDEKRKDKPEPKKPKKPKKPPSSLFDRRFERSGVEGGGD